MPPPHSRCQKAIPARIAALLNPIPTRVLSQVTAACPVFIVSEGPGALSFPPRPRTTIKRAAGADSDPRGGGRRCLDVTVH